MDPADYDVLRVWTRGLHPSSLYPLDRSLKQRPVDPLSVPVGEGEKSAKTLSSRMASLNRWLERLTSLVGPKPLPLVPSDYLCYNHVLLAYRLKGDNSLCLRMLRVSYIGDDFSVFFNRSFNCCYRRPILRFCS